MPDIQLHDAALAAELSPITDPFLREKHLKRAVLQSKLFRCALQGITAKKAAALCGCHKSTAQEIYRDPSFRLMVKERLGEVFQPSDDAFANREQTLQEKIAEASHSAFEVLRTMLEDETQDPRLRARVAETFLDRNPEASRHVSSTVEKNVHHFAAEELMNAARTADELIKHDVIPIRKSA